MEAKISVIIPSFNCATVLQNCIDSIDDSEAEVLIINDGSTDNTIETVNDYIALHKEKKVRLINKDNGGVSSARNLGIQEANGEYICFVDADDYLQRDGLRRLVDLAEQTQCDVLKYRIRHVSQDHPGTICSLSNHCIKIEEVNGFGEALKRYDISDYHVVDALFRRDLIIQNGITFDSDLSIHEDDVFMGKVYCHSSRVIITDLPLYCYIHASNYSTTHHQSIEKQRDLINSGWRAAYYRREYVALRYSDVLPLERLKYMRWVCQPKTAIAAHLSLSEYINVLNKFRELRVYPLDYKWIHIAHWYASPRTKLKLALKTFLCNHPWLGYAVFSLYRNNAI